MDYRSSGSRSVTLDVPPDLNQLSPDTRFGMPPGEAVLASAQTATTSAAAPSTATAEPVAANPIGTATLMRSGAQRWILSKDSPETIWPRLQQFWTDNGFTLASADAASGLIETEWAENRAKLKKDFIRESIGKVFSSMYESGLRDRYIVRVERMPEGTEIYLAHRGLEEVYVDKESRQTRWMNRPSDPELEAAMLVRLLRQVGQAPGAQAETIVPRSVAVAVAAAGTSTPTLEIDDSLANTWRRVSVALDRAAYPVLSRDRRKALLTVQVPKDAKSQAPKGFLARLFSSDEDSTSVDNLPRQRVMLEELAPGKTRISVLAADGQPDQGEVAKALAQALLKALN